MIKIGNSTSHISVYTCQPKSKIELINIIKERISEEGSNCDLNDIDISLITDMSFLFNWVKDFNGDISKWDVSNVTTMENMFAYSYFNGDISGWDMRNVKNISSMFFKSEFNQDISNWDVSNANNVRYMFAYTYFNHDISNWRINKKCDTFNMFHSCFIEEKFKPNI